MARRLEGCPRSPDSLVAIVAYFAAQGAVQPFVDGFFDVNLRAETVVKSNLIKG